MPARSYSDIIRHERERRGIDLSEMSRRLHIRPDILNSIEKGDFDHMPARGYSKNMIRAYARALGLDERQISDMYLKEVQGHELGSSQRYGRSKSRSGSGRQHSRARVGEDDLPSSARQMRGETRITSSRADRSSYRSTYSSGFDDGIPHSSVNGDRGTSSRSRAAGSRDRDAARSQGRPNSSSSRSQSRRRDDARGSASSASSRDRRRSASDGRQGRGVAAAGAAIGSIPSLFGGRSRQEGKVPRSFNTIGSTPPYAQQQRKSSGMMSLEGINLPLVLAIVAALIIVLIVAVVVSNGAKQSTEDVPAIPISGLTDTSSPEDEQLATSTPSIPTQVTFEYTVKDDQQAWIEVYLNGGEEATVATKEIGPKTERFDVTDTLEFRTANPDGVTCTLDGAEVKLEKSTTDEYVYKVSFSDYLKQWKADNGFDDSSSSSAATSSSASADSSSISSSKSPSSSGSSGASS